jgi:hypothetical protein
MESEMEVKTGNGLEALEILPRYVSVFTDRHGKRRYRFRKSGMSGYFSDRPGSKRFEGEYRLFMQGLTPTPRKKKYTSPYSVYFMSCQNAIKIGYARDPRARVKAHQISQPFQLGLLVAVPGGVELEREYHRLFAKYRIRGGWFEDAKEILDEVARLRKGETPLPLLPPSKP